MCDVAPITNASIDTKPWGATIVSPLLLFFAGSIGNILALIVLHKTKSSASIFYTLVAGLAWTDLMGIILTSPVTIAAYVNGRKWYGGEVLCKFNGFIMVCFGLSTPLIVCSMAIERFLAVRCTFVHSNHCNKDRARVTLIVLWIFVFIVGVMPLFGFGKFSVQYPCTWCFLDYHGHESLSDSYGYLYTSLNLIALLLITVCNTYVMFTLLRVRYLKKKAKTEHGKLVSSNCTDNTIGTNKKRKQRSMELQMFVLMCGITMVFLICWAPLMVHILITITTRRTNLPMDITTVRLASANQTLDPWLYILLRKSFFKRIKRILHHFACFNFFFERKEGSLTQRNNHDNHLRCYRKPPCYAALPHFQIQGQITPSGRCVVNFKRRSRSFNEINKQVQSLPDVMKDIYTKSPNDNVPDVAGLQVANDMCMQCRSSFRSSLRTKQNDDKMDGIQVNDAMLDDNQSSDYVGFELDIMTKSNENHDEDSETDNDIENYDVFATKTTELSSEPLTVERTCVSRRKLLSDATHTRCQQKPYNTWNEHRRSHSIT